MTHVAPKTDSPQEFRKALALPRQPEARTYSVVTARPLPADFQTWSPARKDAWVRWHARLGQSATFARYDQRTGQWDMQVGITRFS